uniref:Transmembrane 9 superfamily member n=1 Tax=Gongylonema pulchrum TaxID=637853 RepID=A0A183ER29_9BILA
LPTLLRNGGFRLNLIPSRKITSDDGNDIRETNGNIMHTLPPLKDEQLERVPMLLPILSDRSVCRDAAHSEFRCAISTLNDEYIPMNIFLNDEYIPICVLIFVGMLQVMMKMTLPNILSKDRAGEIGPFTLDCRIKDNVFGYEFDNMKQFGGQTAVSFDFVPRFS